MTDKIVIQISIENDMEKLKHLNINEPCLSIDTPYYNQLIPASNICLKNIQRAIHDAEIKSDHILHFFNSKKEEHNEQK